MVIISGIASGISRSLRDNRGGIHVSYKCLLAKILVINLTRSLPIRSDIQFIFISITTY